MTAKNTEHIHLVRRLRWKAGKCKGTIWSGGGKSFTGIGCHMRALKYARLAQ